ncbi:MAG: hypothetical protein GY822_22745 [Deltaproteobacteria bacterium]|nr:hypothetical protein [Deltaproteobacteria bacterium]
MSKKSRKLVTEVGVVDVTRLSYGNRGIDGVRPLDAALGLPREMYSLGVRKRVAKYAAKMSYDDVTETLADCGIHVPKRRMANHEQTSRTR